MAVQKGDQLLLKVGDGEVSESFATVAGLRTTSFRVNNETVDVTTKDASSKWRRLLEGAGVRSVSVSGAGVFTDEASEELVRGKAFGGEISNYRITFGNGDSMTGAFLVTSYERAGEYKGEETYSLSLESAGDITFTAA